MSVGEIHPAARWHDAVGWYFPAPAPPWAGPPKAPDFMVGDICCGCGTLMSDTPAECPHPGNHAGRCLKEPPPDLCDY